MARRRKPGEPADQLKTSKRTKTSAKRESKKPKNAVLGYMRERYGHY